MGFVYFDNDMDLTNLKRESNRTYNEFGLKKPKKLLEIKYNLNSLLRGLILGLSKLLVLTLSNDAIKRI
jgi:hypothetical protein